MSSFSREREAYFEEIEQILVPSWRVKLRSEGSLGQFVDLEKLIALDVSTLNYILRNMSEKDNALLKDLRQRRKDMVARNFRTIKSELKLLESEKLQLTNEKNALLAEINSYKL